ncbi:hypothetical protein [Pseudomonas sp. 8 R 14]|nr:hypothetical protein [Pseudomonas sp. 8 R 14]
MKLVETFQDSVTMSFQQFGEQLKYSQDSRTFEYVASQHLG